MSPARLPEVVTTPRLILRRWRLADAAVVSRAVEESLDHIRPWMSWAVDEPLSPEARTELMRTFEADWESGGDVVYGALLRDTAPGETAPGDGAPGHRDLEVVVGGCGFSRRAGARALEIGYWVHVDHLRRGYATEMAASLTDAAFTVAGVERVEIHHDRANRRSAAVPARLGFTFEGERPDAEMAPAEVGMDWTWTMARPEWVSRRGRRR
jgi:RimJ/RimL family protein N-acetyltransferase